MHHHPDRMLSARGRVECAPEVAEHRQRLVVAIAQKAPLAAARDQVEGPGRSFWAGSGYMVTGQSTAPAQNQSRGITANFPVWHLPG